MTKYEKWIYQQDDEFILEVHPNAVVTPIFKDGNNNNPYFNLNDLIELDNKYINPEER